MANEATPNPMTTLEELLAERARQQSFFEQLAASVITPHVGEQHRDTVRSILLRATEAGLYTEPK